ncbi:MAG TPA: GvpL/GvpF family gas vesicle protein [Solirubrobacteraceae bacterium]|nr:GvpL/GvpF family gas vesicle protein [Solirubrobacteraceae bacterium]
MSLLVYGIVEATSGEPRGVGLDGRSLHAVAEGPLAAVVSNHLGDRVEPTPDALSAYEQTVRRLMERGAVLPARFGSVLEDASAVLELLRRRRKDLVARLQRVRGAVEIGLRASWRDGPPTPLEARSQSGTSYLRDRLELRQSARRVATELEPLGALARSSRRAIVPRPDLPVLDSYLVDSGRVSEFVALVEQLDDRLDEVELVCTGPWPPYSFADGAPV